MTVTDSVAEPGELGQAVARARRQVGLRGIELAEASGVPRSQIHNIEHEPRRREVSAGKLYEIAKATGVRMEDILGKPYLGQPLKDSRWPALPESGVALAEFKRVAGLSDDEGFMLGHVNYHHRQPITPESWRWLWEAIRRGCMFDHTSPPLRLT